MEARRLSVRVWVGGDGLAAAQVLGSLGEGSGTRLAWPKGRAGRAIACLGCRAPSGATLGALAVARFRRSLEDREVGFVLTLGSVGEDGILGDAGEVSPAEAAEASALAARLDSSSLRAVFSPGAEHALVMRAGSPDLVATDWEEALGKPWDSVLPQGDGEAVLRRYVDDSANLLMGTEANRRRQGEGLPLLNVLWPWAPGMGFKLPRVVLDYGMPLRVETDDWAVEGAAWLAGASLRGEAPLHLRSAPCPWETTEDPEEQAYLARRESGSGWLGAGAATVACTVGAFGWHSGPPAGEPWESALEPEGRAPTHLADWVAMLFHEGGGPVRYGA